MLFNYKREGYLAGRGSIVMEVLPKEIKEDVATEGNMLLGASFQQSIPCLLNESLFFYMITLHVWYCAAAIGYIACTAQTMKLMGTVMIHRFFLHACVVCLQVLKFFELCASCHYINGTTTDTIKLRPALSTVWF